MKVTNALIRLFSTILYFVVAGSTALIGKQIHSSIGWALVDFFFWPFAWMKWLLYREVNLSIIKAAFAWFFV